MSLRPAPNTGCREVQTVLATTAGSGPKSRPFPGPQSGPLQHPKTQKGSTIRAPPPPCPQLAGEDPGLPPALELSPVTTVCFCPHRQPGSLASDYDPLCPETVPHSQPSHARAASSRTREKDDHQAPGIPEQDGIVGGMQAPAEHVGTGKTPGPTASCQELGGSVGTIVDPPETLVPSSPACQCLLTNPGLADLSFGTDLARVGHKRKVQFPSGSAEKRPGVSWPQASFFVPRGPRLCGARTTSSRHLSFPLPGHEPRPLASLLPLCRPQPSLSLSDPSPWQPTDRPPELWATQPPWPGGGCSPGPEDSECAAPGPVSQQVDQLPSCPTGPGRLSAHLHSAVGTQPPGGPVDSQAPSLPDTLPASRGASLSQALASLSPSPSPAPTENSCESLKAQGSLWGHTATDSRARYTDRSYTSAKCCTPSQGRAMHGGAAPQGLPDGARRSPGAWPLKSK